MFIFGGILELTKELNELLCFDFESSCFSLMGSAGHMGGNDIDGFEHHGGEDSPGIKESKHHHLGSPQKTAKKNNFASTSPSKLYKLKNMKQKSKTSANEDEKKESGLVSPTSISMQNSFIIKNADESFDAYYAMMRKRKQREVGSNVEGSPGLHSSPGKMTEGNNFGIVEGIYPAARDGHSTDINENGWMFVFGGDRHHMPFNDLYLIKLM
jgi:hypothetical protein